MTDDTIKLERVDIIHIPKRKENQTWPNYFMECLFEQGIDASIDSPDVGRRVDSDVNLDFFLIHSNTGQPIKPYIEVHLAYMLDDNDIDFRNFRRNPSLRYQKHGQIRIIETSTASYDIEFDDTEAKLGGIYLPSKEWPGLKLPKDLVGEKVLYVLAEYIKKRQEEEK